MTKIFILTKRSFLIIFLVSNTINSLSASPHANSLSYTTHKTETSLHADVKAKLISKGLHEDAAAKKADNLFKQNKNAPHKFSCLYRDNELMLSKEKVIETFAKYALFEKSLNFYSYESLVGFVQHIKPNLNKKELAALRRIANIG